MNDALVHYNKRNMYVHMHFHKSRYTLYTFLHIFHYKLKRIPHYNVERNSHYILMGNSL